MFWLVDGGCSQGGMVGEWKGGDPIDMHRGH